MSEGTASINAQSQDITFGKLAIRDVALTAAAIGAWLTLRSFGETTYFADSAALIAGLGLAAIAYLAHEWGHALAALATGARIYPPGSLLFPSLFSFDTKANTRYQFAMMSLGGFAVTAVAITAAWLWLPPEDFAARVARAGITLLASITLFVEVPILLFGLVTNRIPSAVAVFRPMAKVRSSRTP